LRVVGREMEEREEQLLKANSPIDVIPSGSVMAFSFENSLNASLGIELMA